MSPDFEPVPPIGLVDLEVAATLAKDAPGDRWRRARVMVAAAAIDRDYATALAKALLETDPRAACAFGDDVALLVAWLLTLASARNTGADQ